MYCIVSLSEKGSKTLTGIIIRAREYGKQDQERKAAFNERNTTQQQCQAPFGSGKKLLILAIT
jgi:hypothetical protein